jgi:hypothetical protein
LPNGLESAVKSEPNRRYEWLSHKLGIYVWQEATEVTDEVWSIRMQLMVAIKTIFGQMIAEARSSMRIPY